MTSHISLLMKILVRGSEKEFTTTKGTFWKVTVFLMFKGHHVMNWYKNKQIQLPYVVHLVRQ